MNLDKSRVVLTMQLIKIVGVMNINSHILRDYLKSSFGLLCDEYIFQVYVMVCIS